MDEMLFDSGMLSHSLGADDLLEEMGMYQFTEHDGSSGKPGDGMESYAMETDIGDSVQFPFESPALGQIASSPLGNTPLSGSYEDGYVASARMDIPGARHVRKSGASAVSEASTMSAGEDSRLGSSPRSTDQKRKAPVKWSEEEETRFLEALQLYGRDWKKCAQHVGTRDANNFRSHAQKYFIRLYKHGLPVPRKVAETGEGHTLSGKPLDPNSAAARCYLNGRSYRSDLAKRHRQDSSSRLGKSLP
ncbi:hypothetical protein NDN08_004187 [Rhodosorus marinus]|uniref:HTH myb-type domain-containing protein n=1 Tax=Rhodosorus marinus TaxID=101924 RepID=A0AAV8UHK9_9RHOD|nr:hypothetical protein NDN08_004187 [Rhodosorus marinus]